VELDPFDANVHRFIGWVHMVEREFDQAENAFYKAMKLNPNDADIAIAWALISAFLGNVDVGIETAKGAVERNPFHPEYYLGYQAIIQSLAERYTTSLALFDRMTLIAPPDFWGWYAAASFHAGRTDSARWAAESFINEVGKLWVGNPDEGPEEYVTWFLEITPLKRDEDVDWLISGLKGAGLPYLANNRI
jgi:tetratricopeptide (TPR) repeat protein